MCIAGMRMELVPVRGVSELLDVRIQCTRTEQPGIVGAKSKWQPPECLLVAAAHHRVAGLVVGEERSIGGRIDHRGVQDATEVGHASIHRGTRAWIQGAIDRPKVGTWVLH